MAEGIELEGAERGKRWELYRLLAEPARLRLLACAAHDEVAVGELAEALDEGQPNVSRHVQALKRAGLLAIRKEGTRVLVRLAEVRSDPVIEDALRAGQELARTDGSLARLAEVLKARDDASRAFFDRAAGGDVAPLPSELPAYLGALALLIPDRAFAIDIGTGEGGLLDVLAPVFDRVLAVDRSQAQLSRARERCLARRYRNVELLEADLDDQALRQRAAELGGASVVFASRVLHHAPRPARALSSLASLARPAGAVVVIDYAAHDDESMRERQADLWLGFDEVELVAMAQAAGLEQPALRRVHAVASGVDGHLDWQVMVARAPTRAGQGRAQRALRGSSREGRD